jgi:hypothetical protein
MIPVLVDVNLLRKVKHVFRTMSISVDLIMMEKK